MMVKPLHLITVFCFSLTAPPVLAERLELNNGDLLSADIQKIETETLYAHSVILGDLQIPLAKVKSIQFEGSYWVKTQSSNEFQLVTFNNKDERLYALEPEGQSPTSNNLYKIIALQKTKPKEVELLKPKPAEPKPVEAPTSPIPVAQPTPTITAEALEEAPKNQWLYTNTASGYVDFADIGNKTSDKLMLSATGAHQARNTTHRHTVNWTVSNETTKTYRNEKYVLSYNYNYFLTKKAYWVSDAGYTMDDTVSPYKLISINTGLGYQIFDSDEKSLLIEGGPGYLQEIYRKQPNTSSPSLYTKLSYNQKVTDKLSIFDETKINFNLSHFSNTHVSGKLGAKYQLKESLWLELAHNYNWTNAPEDGFKPFTGNVNIGVGMGW